MPRGGQGLFAVTERFDKKAGVFQEILQVRAHIGVVIGNQHSLPVRTGNGHHGPHICRNASRRSGLECKRGVR